MMKFKQILFLYIVLTFPLFTSFVPVPIKSGIQTIVIDAGHGGKDGGCVGSLANEKDIALSISLKMGAYIKEAFPDVNVIYTRKEDVFVELAERAHIANKNKADLFICVHVNSGQKAAFGTETYVMGPTKSEANLRAAQRENASILLEDNYQERYEDFDPNSTESYIIMTLIQNAYLEQSREFAAKIQKQFSERVGRRDRGVKEAPFLVLHQTTMPSVLIETGFITNEEEQRFLVSEIGQDYIASAIYRAFKEYKIEIDEKTGITAVAKEIKGAPAKEIQSHEAIKPSSVATTMGPIFKVQIATTSDQLELIPDNFRGLKDVEVYEAGGLYRYTVGKATSFSEAASIREELKEKGYIDAFVVAFLDGKRISVGEATRLVKN
jgi:N-acetylmuramoyl-L-alanine amidase